MSLSQTIVAPSRIGPFVFRGTVGSGAFSVVKLSFHEELQQYFACKIVPRNRINSDDLEQRFEMEIRINQQMHHPGVVQIVDLLKDDLNYYIFMEFCPNGELFKYIVGRSKLPETEAAHFMHQFLEAISYVHSLGVAHRDLKPENLLLDPVGCLKISDFGLSKFVGSTGIVSTPCGSPCYASPECLSGHDYDGCKSDIWSIGVIMFAMVTGQLPWTKRNQAQLFNQIRKGEYTIPNYLSDDCSDLLARLMTVNPLKRITVQDALNHPWIKNNSDYDGANFETNFTLVSLKKVDAFFEDNTFNDASVDDQKIQHNTSQKKFTFGSAVRAIQENTLFPSSKIKSRSNMITKSLQYDIKPMKNPTNAALPFSSVGDMPNPQTPSLHFHTPKRTLQTPFGSIFKPKLNAPKSILSWQVFK